MEKPSLFTISQELSSIISELEESGGDITNSNLAERLHIAESQLETKMINYRNYIDFCKGEIERAKQESLRLSNFIVSREKVISKLEGNMLQALLLFGTEDKISAKDVAENKKPVRRLKFGNITFKTHRSTRIEIEDSSKLISEFIKAKIEIKNIPFDKVESLISYINNVIGNKETTIKHVEEINKEKITKAINNGIYVDGARLEDIYHLKIE
jgi:hypothetical protein